MARVASTAIFTSRAMAIDRSLLGLYADPAVRADWVDHVRSVYRTAYDFCLNEFYAENLQIEYLLGRNIKVDGRLGAVWSDWVIVRTYRLSTESLHISFSFDVTLEDPNDEYCSIIEEIARFTDLIYRLPETAVAPDPALLVVGADLRRIYTRRFNALGLSRYCYTSLYGLQQIAATGERPAGLRTNYYRLLYMHATGADSTNADQHLGEPWRSTSFFELYHQPGAILSVSMPYPEAEYEENRGWFQPSPPHHWQPANQHFLEQAYEDYDLLPEYPPLRYLALPCLEYAAIFEETLRASQESTFETAWPARHRRLPGLVQRLLAGTVNAVFFVPRFLFIVFRNHWGRYLQQHLLAASLEGIRLPIVRGFVAEMLDNIQQDRTIQSVMTWTTRRLAVVATLIAVIALISTYAFEHMNGTREHTTQKEKAVSITE